MSSEAQPIETEFESFKTQVRTLRDRHWPRPEGAENVREIFHYCDASGLHGIISTQSLWASDIFSLNDASEVEYARQITSEALRSYPYLRPIAEQLFDQEGSFMDYYRDFNTYVGCFSAGNDLLSQWRAYGAAGHGFAVGFNYELLKQQADGPPPRFSVFPVVYSRDQQLSALHGFMSETAHIIGLSYPLPSKQFAEIGLAILFLMPPLKNPVFSDEREWRMVLVDPEEPEFELCFRPIRGAIKPYVKVPLKPECFTRVVQGPTSHKGLGERFLRRLLQKYGLGHVAVESSEIPLRSL